LFFFSYAAYQRTRPDQGEAGVGAVEVLQDLRVLGRYFGQALVDRALNGGVPQRLGETVALVPRVRRPEGVEAFLETRRTEVVQHSQSPQGHHLPVRPGVHPHGLRHVVLDPFLGHLGQKLGQLLLVHSA